jgi:hypothetical protein
VKDSVTREGLPLTTRRKGRSAGRIPRLGCSTRRALVDFMDPESQRVFRAAAQGVARELGRQAAREYFTEVVSKRKVAF